MCCAALNETESCEVRDFYDLSRLRTYDYYVVIETSHPIYTGIIKGLIGGGGGTSSLKIERKNNDNKVELFCIFQIKNSSNGMEICPKQTNNNNRETIHQYSAFRLLVLSIRSTGLAWVRLDSRYRYTYVRCAARNVSSGIYCQYLLLKL